MGRACWQQRMSTIRTITNEPYCSEDEKMTAPTQLHPGESVSLVFVSPTKAAEYLKLNTNNPRSLRQKSVDYYASELRAGRFGTMTDGIGIDWNNQLTNGQHRLNAIVQTGIGATMIVLTGCNPAIRKITDNNLPRTMAELTDRSPEMCKEMTFLLGCIYGHGKKYAPGAVEDAIAWWWPVHEVIQTAANACRSHRKGNTGALRVSWGLRWAIEKSEVARTYVLEQIPAFFSNDTKSMSQAVATLWRRNHGSGARATATMRTQWAPLVFHSTAYQRRDIEPLLRYAGETVTEMNAWLTLMQEAYIAGPAKDGHPYLWTTVPQLSRIAHGAAATKVAAKQTRAA